MTKTTKEYPAQETLRELFRYDPEVGALMWQVPKKTGRPRKPSVKLYREILIDGVRYLEHRLVWIFHNGSIPDGMEIDHIDGNPGNNRIENLRLATTSENQRNAKAQRPGMPKGVCWDRRKEKWKAWGCLHWKQIHLGYFEDFEGAKAAAATWRQEHHGEFYREARGRRRSDVGRDHSPSA